MIRALATLLVPTLIAAACARPNDDAAPPAQSAQPARDTAQARTAVLGLERELFQSFVRNDSAPSARILADDYTGFSGDGHRETKAQALANIHRDSTAASASAVDSILVDSTVVRVLGDAAVAQSSGRFKEHDARQSVTLGFRNTDVFVWRDGRWQLVATHLSKVPAS